MTLVKTTIDRRSFLKASAAAGGGLMISFNWLAGVTDAQGAIADPAETWNNLNSYISISSDGIITLMSPNPEFGSNVKTSMPMIVAEELDVDWKDVVVEQADFFPKRFERQFKIGRAHV